MAEKITNKEMLVLSKLYLSKYQKGLLKDRGGSRTDFIAEMGEFGVSQQYILTILADLIRKQILEFSCHDFERMVKLHVVNKKKIWDMLRKSEVFIAIEKIMDERYIQVDR